MGGLLCSRQLLSWKDTACSIALNYQTSVSANDCIDVVLIGSFYAYPAFNKKYGTLQADGTYGLSAAWQAGLSNGVNVGEILGLLANGIISERFGYRKTMIGSLLLTIAFIFIHFFAQNVQTLLVGEILMGIPLGVFQTLTVTYASEVCPVVLRAYLTTYVNMCWVIGQFVASGKIGYCLLE